MPELKMVTPLLSNMEVVECVSSHAGTSVYIVRSTKTQTTYMLKHISIPESQRQIDALMYTGAASTKEDAQKYYEQVVTDYQKELETLEILSGSPNVESYRSYQIEPKEDGVGFDLYLLAENRVTLKDTMDEKPMTKLAAVNLTLDICNALVDLREAGLIHRDVKPSNIYLNSQGHFVLGDLGLAKIDELKYASIPEGMLSSYSAPELFELVGSIDKTIDIYSVGMILYRIFNGNHGPFEDERTTAKAADCRRITGEEMPAPMYADYEMLEIIKKATAFQPEDRYQEPSELRDVLIEYVKRNQLEDVLIVPPIVSDEEPVAAETEEEEVEPVQFADTEEMSSDFKESFSPDTEMLNSIIESVHRDLEREEAKNPTAQEEDEELEEFEKPKRKKKASRWIATAICGALLLAIAAALVYFLIIAPQSVHIGSISLVSCDSTEMTVHVDSHEPDGAFDVICSDAYGNTFRAPYFKGKDVTFASLASGTQYTVTVDPANDKKISGNAVLRVSTIAETEILSFAVNPIALTQVELNLNLSGPEPEQWTVRYYTTDESESQTVSFTGHTVTVPNLESDALYTFVLTQPEQIRLTGELSAVYSTVPTVNIEKTTVALSSTSAILSWTITGEAPEYWTVTVNGADGYTNEYELTAPTVTLEGLTSGIEYEVVISAPTMLQDGYLTITPTVISVSDLQVAEQDGNWLVTWNSTSDAESSNWTLFCTPSGAEKAAGLSIAVENTDSYLIESEQLLPNTTYQVSLELANGDLLEGSTNSEFTTPAAKNFSSYGFNSGYIGIYHKPDKDEWSAADLAGAATRFTTEEKIAFAIQGIGTLQKTDDEVELLYVVKDALDVVISSQIHSVKWNDMWNGDLFVDSLEATPKKAGVYVMEIYFNGEYVVKATFEIT